MDFSSGPSPRKKSAKFFYRVKNCQKFFHGRLRPKNFFYRGVGFFRPKNVKTNFFWAAKNYFAETLKLSKSQIHKKIEKTKHLKHIKNMLLTHFFAEF